MGLGPDLTLLGVLGFSWTFQIPVCVGAELFIVSGMFYLGLGYSAYMVMSIANSFKAFCRGIEGPVKHLCPAFSAKTGN